MSDGDALLRTILERPAEDTPRLVYADWLEERGQEQWAQFIRATRANWHYVYFLRNELARSIPTATFSGYGREEGDSPDFDLPRWSFSFPERFAFGRAIWDRGFVSHLVLPLAAFMEHAPALFRAHPIERVTLTDRAIHSHGGGPWCAWWRDYTPNQSLWPNNRTHLPRKIFDRLSRGELIQSEYTPAGNWFRRYPSDECPGPEDLSDACVAYGRECAGLSKLARSEPK